MQLPTQRKTIIDQSIHSSARPFVRLSICERPSACPFVCAFDCVRSAGRLLFGRLFVEQSYAIEMRPNGVETYARNSDGKVCGIMLARWLKQRDYYNLRTSAARLIEPTQMQS